MIHIYVKADEDGEIYGEWLAGYNSELQAIELTINARFAMEFMTRQDAQLWLRAYRQAVAGLQTELREI